DVGFLALREVALRVHDDAAGDRTVGAGVAGLCGADQLEGPDRGGLRRLHIAEAERSERRTRKPRAGARKKAAPRELHIHGPSLLRTFAPAGGRSADQRSRRDRPNEMTYKKYFWLLPKSNNRPAIRR